MITTKEKLRIAIIMKSEIIYNIIIFALVLLAIMCKALNPKHGKKVFLIFSFLTISLLSAFRYQRLEMSDFQINMLHMKRAYSVTFQDALKMDEAPLWILRWLLTKLSNNPQVFFIFTSLIIVGIYMLTICKYSDDIYISTIMFYSIGGFFSSLNITSQYLAISICLLTIPFIIKRQPLRFFLCITIAILIHISAVVFIPLYFICSFYISKKNALLYIVGCFFAFFSFGYFINYFQTKLGLYNQYKEGYYGTNTANMINIVIPALVLLLYIWCVNTNKIEVREQNDNSSSDEYLIVDNLFLHMAIWHFICYLYAVTNMLIISRIGHYFNICILYLPTLLSRKKAKNNTIVKLLLYLLCIVYIVFMNYSNKLQPNPYELFWNI